MPHRATYLRSLPAAAMFLLALGSAAVAGQPAGPRPSEAASYWPVAVELRATSEVPTTGGAGCRFGEWRLFAAEACAAAQQPTAVATGEDQAPPEALDVKAGDPWFSPTELTVSGTGSTIIRLQNTGRVVHNFTVDELGIEIVVSRGGIGEAILTEVRPGTYAFYCSVSGHREAGMEGTLIVE